MSKHKTIQSLKGMHDILPADQPYWQFILKKTSSLLADYDFERIDTPLVESSQLFLRSVGAETDIVSKEMYVFKTKSGEEVALRPEGTAAVARAYIEHGMNVMPHPIKLWYWGPMFRHDQPQAGRYRQFYQCGVELFGDEHPAAEAEVIFIALRLLEILGFKNLCLKINSIGDASCRPQYVKALKDFLKNKTKKLCVQCQAREKKNVLRVMDCKEEACQEAIKNGAPQMLDYLDENCRNHFKKVIEFLDEIKAPYSLDPFLARGLDYYTRTVFEIIQEEPKEAVPEKPDQKEEEIQAKEVSVRSSTLIAGGRYNDLISLLGGPKTPAVGWAGGLERIILAMKNLGLKPGEVKSLPKVFLAQLGDLGKRKSLVLFEELRRAGIKTGISLGRDSIKAQLRIANRLKVKLSLIIGQKEAIDKTVILREMDSGIQEVIPLANIAEAVKKRLKK